MQKIEIFSYKDRQELEAETVVESLSVSWLILKNVKGNLARSRSFFDTNVFAIAWNGQIYYNCRRAKTRLLSKDLVFTFTKRAKAQQCL